MISHCPICGRPLAVLEQMLAGQTADYQCHHCWNRIHATGPVTPPLQSSQRKKSRILGTRRTAKARGRKS